MRFAVLVCTIAIAQSTAPNSPWMTWSAAQAESVGKSTVARGRIGGGRRLLNTERALSYKLAATWLTSEVVHASARLLQLRSRLTDSEAAAAAEQALAAGDTVIMIDLDPDEGSGVIPLDWEAFLQPKNAPERAVIGEKSPRLRDVRLLSGVVPRNYDYDRFWIIFSLTAPDGQPLFRDTDPEAELVVRIRDREGRVTWPIPPSIRTR
jgi:hypothetical protein